MKAWLIPALEEFDALPAETFTRTPVAESLRLAGLVGPTELIDGSIEVGQEANALLVAAGIWVAIVAASAILGSMVEPEVQRPAHERLASRVDSVFTNTCVKVGELDERVRHLARYASILRQPHHGEGNKYDIHCRDVADFLIATHSSDKDVAHYLLSLPENIRHAPERLIPLLAAAKHHFQYAENVKVIKALTHSRVFNRHPCIAVAIACDELRYESFEYVTLGRDKQLLALLSELKALSVTASAHCNHISEHVAQGSHKELTFVLNETKAGELELTQKRLAAINDEITQAMQHASEEFVAYDDAWDVVRPDSHKGSEVINCLVGLPGYGKTIVGLIDAAVATKAEQATYAKEAANFEHLVPMLKEVNPDLTPEVTLAISQNFAVLTNTLRLCDRIYKALDEIVGLALTGVTSFNDSLDHVKAQVKSFKATYIDNVPQAQSRGYGNEGFSDIVDGIKNYLGKPTKDAIADLNNVKNRDAVLRHLTVAAEQHSLTIFSHVNYPKFAKQFGNVSDIHGDAGLRCVAISKDFDSKHIAKFDASDKTKLAKYAKALTEAEAYLTTIHGLEAEHETLATDVVNGTVAKHMKELQTELKTVDEQLAPMSAITARDKLHLKLENPASEYETKDQVSAWYDLHEKAASVLGTYVTQAEHIMSSAMKVAAKLNREVGRKPATEYFNDVPEDEATLAPIPTEFVGTEGLSELATAVGKGISWCLGKIGTCLVKLVTSKSKADTAQKTMVEYLKDYLSIRRDYDGTLTAIKGLTAKRGRALVEVIATDAHDLNKVPDEYFIKPEYLVPIRSMANSDVDFDEVRKVINTRVFAKYPAVAAILAGRKLNVTALALFGNKTKYAKIKKLLNGIMVPLRQISEHYFAIGKLGEKADIEGTNALITPARMKGLENAEDALISIYEELDDIWFKSPELVWLTFGEKADRGAVIDINSNEGLELAGVLADAHKAQTLVNEMEDVLKEIILVINAVSNANYHNTTIPSLESNKAISDEAYEYIETLYGVIYHTCEIAAMSVGTFASSLMYVGDNLATVTKGFSRLNTTAKEVYKNTTATKVGTEGLGGLIVTGLAIYGAFQLFKGNSESVEERVKKVESMTADNYDYVEKMMLIDANVMMTEQRIAHLATTPIMKELPRYLEYVAKVTQDPAKVTAFNKVASTLCASPAQAIMAGVVASYHQDFDTDFKTFGILAHSPAFKANPIQVGLIATEDYLEASPFLFYNGKTAENFITLMEKDVAFVESFLRIYKPIAAVAHRGPAALTSHFGRSLNVTELTHQTADFNVRAETLSKLNDSILPDAVGAVYADAVGFDTDVGRKVIATAFDHNAVSAGADRLESVNKRIYKVLMETYKLPTVDAHVFKDAALDVDFSAALSVLFSGLAAGIKTLTQCLEFNRSILDETIAALHRIDTSIGHCCEFIAKLERHANTKFALEEFLEATQIPVERFNLTYDRELEVPEASTNIDEPNRPEDVQSAFGEVTLESVLGLESYYQQLSTLGMSKEIYFGCEALVPGVFKGIDPNHLTQFPSRTKSQIALQALVETKLLRTK